MKDGLRRFGVFYFTPSSPLSLILQIGEFGGGVEGKFSLILPKKTKLSIMPLWYKLNIYIFKLAKYGYNWQFIWLFASLLLFLLIFKIFMQRGGISIPHPPAY